MSLPFYRHEDHGSKLKLIGLFSGVGGLEMGVIGGFADAGFQLKPVLFCELELFPQQILRRHHPGVPIHDDVRTLADIPTCDVCVFGFPCQDVSIANSRNPKGISGERSGLFHEGWRVAKASNASLTIIENVPAIKGRGLLELVETVRADGYNIEWDIVSAAECGAPHLRKRFFAVIHKAEQSLMFERSRLISHIGGSIPTRGACIRGKMLEFVPPPRSNPRGDLPLFPTVTRDSSTERRRKYAQGGLPLTMAVNTWPTPRANKTHGDSVGRFLRAKSEGKVHTPPLETAVWLAETNRFPTPLRSTYKGTGPLGSKSYNHHMERRNHISAVVQASTGVSGKLSPEWTERLMGFPDGYTNLEGPPQTDFILSGKLVCPDRQQSEITGQKEYGHWGTLSFPHVHMSSPAGCYHIQLP